MEIISLVYNKNIFNEQHVLFHINIKIKENLRSGVLMAAKSAITNMHHKKLLAPVHDRVTAAFLSTQLLLLCDTYILNGPEGDNWMMLRRTIQKLNNRR